MRWLKRLFRKRKLEAQLDSELRFHIEQRTADLTSAGMELAEARWHALIEFGGVERVKEECREARGTYFLESLLQDIRYALRTLRKSPGFTVVAILTLALGIGANTAIFSVVDGILLRPLPFAHPGRLVSVWQTGVPKGIFSAIRDSAHTMAVAAYTFNSGVNLVRHGAAMRVTESQVSANLFQVLGVNALIGRTFENGEDSPARDRVAVLSNALWRDEFGRNPQVIGRSITLNRTPFQVVGVMPADFAFPSAETQLWTPIELFPRVLWGNFFYVMVGRLRPRVTVSEARAEFKALVPRAVKLMPWKMPPDWGSGADVLPLQEHIVSDVRTKVLILFGAVALILLIACSNVANLLFARAAGRRREIALRAALGAGGTRIARQLLTESVVLAMVGGGLGLGLAFPGLAFLRHVLPNNTPRLSAVTIDWRVLAFTAAIALAAGVAFGIMPALRASRLDLERELHSASGKASPSRSQRRVSSALVTVGVAVEVIVVIGATLLGRSLWTLVQRDPGFQPAHVLTARVNQIASSCKGADGCVGFYREVLGRVGSIPGVVAAGAATGVPGSGASPGVFSVEGHPLSISGARPISAWTSTVTPGYLRAMGIPLLRGRSLTAADGPNSQPVVLVSAAAAHTWWPGQDPIGKRVKFSFVHNWRTVVGIVGEVRDSGLANPLTWEAGTVGHVYFPYAQGGLTPGSPPDLNLVVRVHGDPEAIAGELRTALASADPRLPLTGVRTMDQVLSESIAGPRSTTWLFLSFGVLALLMGTIGVYGIVSYSVVSRTGEFGIRVALGATKQTVLKLVLREGLKLTLAGIIVGLACSFALGRIISALLFGVSSHDLVAFVVATAVTVLAAVAAICIPAHRAMQLDPMAALRQE